MKTLRFDAPLAEAAARSLKRSAQAARKRAAQTNVPLVLWKSGRVSYLPVSAPKPRKRATVV